MRALSHCDFCEADAAGTFELLPPELEPTEAEQRRVVLCRSCGDRLEDLLEPLLARAGVESSEEPTSGSDSDAVTDADDVTEADDATDADDVTDADDSSPCGDASGVEPTAEDPDRTGRPSVIDVSEAKADAVADDSDREGSGTDDRDRGITLERSPDSESEDTEDVSTESSSTDEQRDSSDTAEDSSSSNSSNSNANSRTSPPQGYGKVIRLLRNREFPMDRSAVETLAAGAYDLETREVEAIIEYALEDGEFAENGEQLVRS